VGPVLLLLLFALHNVVRIIEEDKVEQGELKNKYKISLTRNCQLVVYGYYYAFIASSYVVLYQLDGYEGYIGSGEGIDLDFGGFN
jgi:hypothetical protein